MRILPFLFLGSALSFWPDEPPNEKSWQIYFKWVAEPEID
jgi:hypothetical protein